MDSCGARHRRALDFHTCNATLQIALQARGVDTLQARPVPCCRHVGIECSGPGNPDRRRTPDLVALGQDVRGEDRFTTRDMLETERRLHRPAVAMAERARHGVDARNRDAALARAEARGLIRSAEQAEALAHVTDGRHLGIVIGHAGTGQSAMLGVAMGGAA